jgi:hypothetical protein
MGATTVSVTSFMSAVLAVFPTMTPVGAGGETVGFPRDYAKGVMYAFRDLDDVKEYREFYITPAALDAARKDQPLPSGTVITLARYKIQLDVQGTPMRDGNGRFIKIGLKAFRVMEKRSGWGSDYPISKRNGEWEYQAFLPDGGVVGGFGRAQRRARDLGAQIASPQVVCHACGHAVARKGRDTRAIDGAREREVWNWWSRGTV